MPMTSFMVAVLLVKVAGALSWVTKNLPAAAPPRYWSATPMKLVWLRSARKVAGDKRFVPQQLAGFEGQLMYTFVDIACVTSGPP